LKLKCKSYERIKKQKNNKRMKKEKKNENQTLQLKPEMAHGLITEPKRYSLPPLFFFADRGGQSARSPSSSTLAGISRGDIERVNHGRV
jgi:hypothetical protein